VGWFSTKLKLIFFKDGGEEGRETEERKGEGGDLFFWVLWFIFIIV
jgi:hypothetical protein